MLNAFYTITEGQRQNIFDTNILKLDGIMICNTCDATTLGYSQRRFKQLKQSQKLYRRISTVYKNVYKLREGTKVSAARECLSAFVNEAWCTQPHLQDDKCDGRAIM